MEKTNSTFFIPCSSRGISIFKNYFYTLTLLTLCLFTTQSLTAQDCTLGCSDANISLGTDCLAEITPDMVASATGGCSTLSVELTYLDDTPVIGSPYVDGSHLGMTLIAIVIDSGPGNNSCWSYITIEDKLKPFFNCPDDITISCVEMLNFPPPSASDNCDPNPEEILVDYSEEALSCDPDYVKIVTRKYIAVDASGNVSDDTCVQTIYLERFDIDEIDMPDSYLVVDNTDLACDGNYPLDANGNPHPSYTGVPTYDGIDLWPDGIAICNVMVSYSDLNIPTFGCVEKIMRTWTAREWWCSEEIEYTHVQIIEISDEEGPDITCPNIFDVSTDGVTCTGQVYIPAAIVSDNCSEPVTVTVSYPGGIENQNGNFWVDLPVGTNEIIYTAYDDCLNSSTCSVFVEVIDDTPPVPICDLNTTVSLGGDGLAVIYWQTFDDGSYDDCGYRLYSCKKNGGQLWYRRKYFLG